MRTGAGTGTPGKNGGLSDVFGAPTTSLSTPFLPGVPVPAPVSIVLIAAETSSMWPNSSAAMLATRS